MEVNGMIIHCPYWMNKIQAGQVKIRGFSNGKGSASEIRQELTKQIDRLSIAPEHLTSEYIRKLAKRNRIGIDCSGFVYRVITVLIHLGYTNTSYTSPDQIFSGGITKTNARRLTSKEFCIRIDKVKDIQLGDLIRLRGGRHVAIVMRKDSEKIVYAHSSNLSTKIKGVHVSQIEITDQKESLAFQHWLERSNNGEDFGKKFFQESEGDGVFRLKIFAK